jgi:threonine aldolase
MIERLAEDHDNARRLADAIAEMPGVTGLDPARVRTNFVFFELTKPELRMPFLDALERAGTQMIDYPGGERIRAVTHYGISRDDIDQAIGSVRRALGDVGLAPAQAPAAAVAGG